MMCYFLDEVADVSKTGLEEKLDAVLASAAKQKVDKKLIDVIVDRLDEIERSKANGVSYKEMAESIKVDYAIFLTTLSRARKRVDKKKQVSNKLKQDLKQSALVEDERKDLLAAAPESSIDTDKAGSNETGNQENPQPVKRGPKVLQSKTAQAFSENLDLDFLKDKDN